MRELILKEAKKSIREYEVFFQETEVNEIHLQKNRINFFDKTNNSGYGIRVKTKGLGFSSSNILSDSAARQTIKNALINSRMTKKVDFTFPSSKPFKKVENIIRMYTFSKIIYDCIIHLSCIFKGTITIFYYIFMR